VRADDGIRANFNIGRDPGAGIDNRRGVDCHFDRAFPAWRFIPRPSGSEPCT
jgi:hypothetical protein